MGAVVKRHIGETGTAEVHWSELLSCVPMLELDDWVNLRARLVVVSPHPDDEVLACGGLLARHMDRGGQSLVLAVTNGEASHLNSHEWIPEDLGFRRCIESEKGLHSLGVPANAVTRLGFPDGRVALYMSPLRESLARCIHAGDVVVSTWRLDGHPDHEAVGAVAEQVCAETGAKCLQAPVWMWHWSKPRDPSVPWHLLKGVPLNSEIVKKKLIALSAHLTQLARRSESEGPVLDALIVERASRAAEYFFVHP